ncbi:MAG: MarR family transcriptional regulator [Christensenella sp.]|nr:MarR family transcriptional regulator [Christensenella sp.]
MSNYTEQPSVDLIFKQLNDKANLLYKFVMLYGDYVAENQDYGTGELINMVEVHTLTAIEENPGVNISELANMWNRTKGAISQTATKLEKKGYIQRRKQDGNAKTVMLFPTEKGIRLSQAHKRYDAIEVSKTVDELLRAGCTPEELDTFFKVVTKYIEILL